MATEKDTHTESFWDLFILGGFNIMFLLEKKKQEGKPEKRIGGCIFEYYVM